MATYTAGFGAAGRLQHLPLRKALEQYAGAQNRPALIKLLSPVQQAAERCEWVQTLVDSGAIYQPMAWSAGRAYRVPAERPGARGEWRIRPAAGLVEETAPAASVGKDRDPDTSDVRR